MVRLPGIVLMGALLLAVACGAERREDARVVIASPPASTATAASASTVESEPTPASPGPTVTSTPALVETPASGAGDLASRFGEAALLIEEAPIRLGVAVLTADGAEYVGGDDGTFALASVAKIPVMIATLERAAQEERELTSGEQELLRLMITVSSNSATDALWRSLGGAEGLRSLLEPLGVSGIDYALDDQWGDSRASASELVTVLTLLTDAESPLAEEGREHALELLSQVVADQRWGAAAGVDVSVGSDASLAIKNGWYPESAGWLLNTAGVITTADAGAGAQSHIVVVLTEGAETQTEGVALIEEIAAAINHAIVPPALVVEPTPPTFVASALPDREDETPAVQPTATPEPEPTPTPPAIALVPFGLSDDVLVPSGVSLVGSEGTPSELTLWYQLPVEAAEEMVQLYGDSMSALGWLQVAGPPLVVLSKSSEARWVGLSTYPAGTGASLVEVTISPAPGVVPAGADSP